ncbi:MAG TPA: zinc-binding alcohol dehydrogenase family protein [Puia sp.]|nr:zinc-binding alcohol dehydrogenase family protein [Puia sp.]
MKAAVLYSNDGAPRYADMPEPTPQNDQEVLVSVKAVALKHFDRSRATGAHYSTEGQEREATVIGGDGVCVLPDGVRVYALGASGMMAEKATVEKDRIVPLPAGLDDITAAALPNAVIGAAMALRFRAGIEPGDTVLINGATGFTGRVAVQIARYYGAGRIIATGRNDQSLQELKTLGADETLLIDGKFAEHLQQLHQKTPIHVVIDYLWGQTAEIILATIKGKGSFTPHMRFVSVGAMTGDTIQLSAANLRSANLQLSGSGLGSWTKGQVRLLFSEILPEMFQLAAEGRLKIDTVRVPLSDIENLSKVEVPGGQRLVVEI